MGWDRDPTLQERFARVVEQLATRTFPYEPRDERPINWAKYTQAQVHELNDTLNLIHDVVDAIEKPSTKQGTGRPRENLATDLAKALLLQGYFNCSNRLASGYVLVFQEKLGITKHLNYKAIERAYEDPDVKLILHRVHERIQQSEKPYAAGFTTDGSGMPRDVKGNWERDKISADKKKERFDGAVMMMTLPHQVFTAWVSHPVGFASESPTLAPLVSQTMTHYGSLKGAFTADAAFLGRDNCTLIEENGATPFIFPKRGINYERQGMSAWARMQRSLLADPQAWLRAYHARSNAESGWARHKHRHPTPLRKRIKERRETEKSLRFTVDNLSGMARLGHTEAMDLSTLRPPAS